jgi:hypothetical protein
MAVREELLVKVLAAHLVPSKVINSRIKTPSTNTPEKVRGLLRKRTADARDVSRIIFRRP